MSSRRSFNRAFTIIELIVVIVVISMLAALVGGHYSKSYNRTSLVSASKQLSLMAKYARLRAIEKQQVCKLYLDSVDRSFYLMADHDDPDSESDMQIVVSNPYCRKQQLKPGIAFEVVDVTPAGEELGLDIEGNVISFYRDGTCDKAIVQIGDGRYAVTAVFDSAYAKVKLFEVPAEELELEETTIDLDINSEL